VLTFLDQSGKGYVPPGVIVTAYPLGVPQIPKNVAGSGTVGVAGSLNIPLAAGEYFVATFTGNSSQTPQYAAIFETSGNGSNTAVVVPAFGSPVLSADGYADQLRNVHYPKGWLDDEENTPVANTWFAAIGGLIGDVDTTLQIERTAMRLSSCTGSYLDSFMRDLFNNTFPRLTGETDPLYYARLLVFTNRIRMTLACISAVVQTYIASSVNLPKGGSGLGLDSEGGLDDNSGSFDQVPPGATGGSGAGTANNLGLDTTEGGLDTTEGALDNAQVPTGLPSVVVFDVQSDPVSSAAVSLLDGQVCIYFKYQGYNNPPQVMGAPDAVLIYLVNIVKRCGTGVVYVTNKY
jgi:hypothetical protein